jgi:hypothetical protein
VLEDRRKARRRGRGAAFGYLFVVVSGGAFAFGVFEDDKTDWVLGGVFLLLGVTLMWVSLRQVVDRERLILIVVGVALFGFLLGAVASPVVAS